MYKKTGTRTLSFPSVPKNNSTESAIVRTAFGGKGLNMPISCVAFGFTNKQNCSKNKKNSSEEGKHESCEEGSPERVHIAFRR